MASFRGDFKIVTSYATRYKSSKIVAINIAKIPGIWSPEALPKSPPGWAIGPKPVVGGNIELELEFELFELFQTINTC